MADITITPIDRESLVWLVNELEDFEKDKAIRSGLSAATLVFKTIGRRNLRRWMGSHGHPEGVTGNLLASFKNRIKRRRPGALSGFILPEGSHVWLVDQGTTLRNTKHHDTGIMPASHFWENAAKEGNSKAVERLREGVERKILKIRERKR